MRGSSLAILFLAPKSGKEGEKEEEEETGKRQQWKKLRHCGSASGKGEGKELIDKMYGTVNLGQIQSDISISLKNGLCSANDTYAIHN